MTLTIRQVSNRKLLAGCIQLDTPVITITLDVLDFLGYHGNVK